MNQNQYTATGINQPNEVPETQVESQFILLETEIRDNSEIICKLNDRLLGVIRTEAGECGNAKQSAPEAMLVPHAERLRNAFKSLRNQNIEMRRILDAIEL